MSIQLHILPEKQQIFYKGFREASWISQYYLAGGTALALQIGLKNYMIMSLAQPNRFLNPINRLLGKTKRELSFRIRRLTDEKSFKCMI